MSKSPKVLLMALVIGAALTLAGLAVSRQMDNGDAANACYAPPVRIARGYPLGYLLSTKTQAPAPNECSGVDAASGSIIKSVPGQPQVSNFIQNHEEDWPALAQDFVIMSLIALYPASYVVSRRRT